MLTSRINHVHIENFKSLANVDVDLTDLNVLVGVNGSGKSNFIDALKFVRDALDMGLNNALNSRGGIDTLGYGPFGKKTNKIAIGLHLTIDGAEAEYSFAIDPESHGIREEFSKL